MRAVSVSQTFEATIGEVERRWYDTADWPRWVDGLDTVLAVDRGWPRPGAAVTWQSVPAGRGRVTERVIGYEPLRGQALEVSDDSIRGRQSVAFAPAGDLVNVVLSLEYELLRRSVVSPVVDLLFIRRAMTASLSATLSRFGAGLRADRQA